MKSVYFIGIGGIGMSAVAQYFIANNYFVAGYDRIDSPITEMLESKGAIINFIDQDDSIPKEIKEDRESLIIYTPAIPKSSIQLHWFRERGYRVIKRADALNEIAKGKRCLAVAGSHGKSSISATLAHVLHESGEGVTSFLGALSVNWKSNFSIGESDIMVVEADEYDRSFHKLWPEIAIISSIDADHLDVYGSIEEVVKAFSIFASQVESGGALVVRKGVEEKIELEIVKAKLYRYSIDEEADYWASNIVPIERGYFNFTFNYPGGSIDNCQVGIAGRINLENGVAAAAAAHLKGLSPNLIVKALGSYRGIKRRLEVIIDSEAITYIDDYAHHPVELLKAISAAREIGPDKRVTLIFQPHLYSRTRDFAPQFSEALSKADRVIMLDIYPAREEPIEGVTSQLIAENIDKDKVVVTDKEHLLKVLEKEELELLISCGAGDIDRLVKPIAQYLRRRYSV